MWLNYSNLGQEFNIEPCGGVEFETIKNISRDQYNKKLHDWKKSGITFVCEKKSAWLFKKILKLP